IADNNVSEQQITALNNQLASARAIISWKRAQLDQASRIINGNGDIFDIPEKHLVLSQATGPILEIPDLMESAAVSQLRVQQTELSSREAELRVKLGERHAEVIAVREHLAGITERLNVEVGHVLA